MNAHHEMTHEEILRTRLAGLKAEHRTLDDTVHQLAQGGAVNTLQLGRLKKQKLKLKDQIARLEDELTPDIIA